MLEDRPYMRRRSLVPRRSATVTLLLVNVAAFLLQQFLPGFSGFWSHQNIDKYLALSAEGLRHGYLWQLLTFQFLHDGWMHLAFNCLAIFFIGPPVEEALGRRNFLTLYFSSGVIGGLFQALAGVLLGHDFAAPVVGASAGGFGLMAAFAVLFPDQ